MICHISIHRDTSEACYASRKQPRSSECQFVDDTSQWTGGTAMCIDLIPVISQCVIVEPVLNGHKNMVSQDRWSWSIYIEMEDFLPQASGPSRQVVSHGSGLSRQVLLYC